jgi:hypothetical protein
MAISHFRKNGGVLMPKRLIPTLSDDQRHALCELRDRSPKPYLRERASAILKLASGQTASAVAAAGLLREHYYETVCDWFHRFQSEGVEGLLIKSGRGRKPAFSPSTAGCRPRRQSTAASARPNS